MGADLYLMPPNLKAEELTDDVVNPVMEATWVDGGISDQREGYFRDSYNNSSLFWQFGLSWWQLLKDELCLKPADCEALLADMQSKEATFKKNIRAYPKKSKELIDREYFIDKYARFRAFLNQAITENRLIYCSV